MVVYSIAKTRLKIPCGQLQICYEFDSVIRTVVLHFLTNCGNRGSWSEAVSYLKHGDKLLLRYADPITVHAVDNVDDSVRV